MPPTVFKVGKIYHYRFQVKPFPREQRTTRERDKARAQAVADRAYNDAVLRSNGGKPVPTLAQLAAQWLEVRGPVLSDSHRRGVQTFMNHHMYDLGPVLVSDITTLMVEKARGTHMATRRPSSANTWLRILKLLVNWAVRCKVLPGLPFNVPLLAVQKKPRTILPTSRAQEWLNAVDVAVRRRPSAAVGIRLMFGLGIRESEAATARWEWIDWERGTYTPGVTKGKEAVPLPMPEWLFDYLLQHREAEGLIAPGARGRQLPRGFSRRLITIGSRAIGLEGLTPHRLRGTLATLLSEEGTPIQTVQAVMRHKDPMTTMGYLEVDLNTAKRAMGRIAKRISEGGRKNGEG